MEIYNEQAYDLLDKKHLELPIEQWSKVLYLILKGSGSSGRRPEQHPFKKHKRNKHRERARRPGFADDGEFHQTGQFHSSELNIHAFSLRFYNFHRGPLD